MGLTFRAAAANSANTAAASQAVPAGTAVGDFLVAVLNLRDVTHTVTGTSSGWQLLGPAIVGPGGTFEALVYTKPATAGDIGTTPVWTLSAATRWNLAIYAASGGGGAVDSVLLAANSSTASTSVALNPPGPTAIDGDLLLGIAACEGSVNSAQPTFTAPAGWTRRAQTSGVGTGVLNGALALFDITQTTHGVPPAATAVASTPVWSVGGILAISAVAAAGHATATGQVVGVQAANGAATAAAVIPQTLAAAAVATGQATAAGKAAAAAAAAGTAAVTAAAAGQATATGTAASSVVTSTAAGSAAAAGTPMLGGAAAGAAAGHGPTLVGTSATGQAVTGTIATLTVAFTAAGQAQATGLATAGARLDPPLATLVTNICVDPTGAPDPGVPVVAQLVAVDGWYANGGSELIAATSTVTDDTGAWSLQLVPNVALADMNSYYQITEGPRTYQVIVPSTGPVTLQSILMSEAA